MRSLILNVLVCAALAVALRATALPGARAHDVVIVGVDVDTTGNEAASLGEPQFCRTVEPGSTFDVDVFLHEIPAGRNLAGFNYTLGYDSQRVSVQARDHRLLLVANRDGSGVADLSEEAPDSDGAYTATVADLSPAGVQPGPLAGVLGRYTIQVASTAPAGIFSLTVADVNLVDGATEDIPVDEIQNAKIAVGQPCSPADQTPEVVRPTPTPTTEPTATTTPAPGTSTTARPSGSATTSASPSPAGETPGAEDDDDGFPWIAAAVSALIGLAVLGGGGLLIRRRWPGRPPGTGL